MNGVTWKQMQSRTNYSKLCKLFESIKNLLNVNPQVKIAKKMRKDWRERILFSLRIYLCRHIFSHVFFIMHLNSIWAGKIRWKSLFLSLSQNISSLSFLFLRIYFSYANNGNISFHFSCCVYEQNIFPYLMLLLLIIETEAPPFSTKEKWTIFFVCHFFPQL